MENLKTYAIILASGTGSRYGSDLPKQFTFLGDKLIIEYPLDTFENSDSIDEILLVVPNDYIDLAKNIVSKNNYKKVKNVISGGKTRKDSSYNAISYLKDEEAVVLIHDGVRPFVSQKIIADCISALQQYDAIGVAIDTTDTIIEVEDNFIKAIPERRSLKRIQTPQGFKLSVIRKAHELAKNDSNFTDDCGLVVKYGLADVYIVEGSNKNIKLTYPEDLYIAEKYCS